MIHNMHIHGSSVQSALEQVSGGSPSLYDDMPFIDWSLDDVPQLLDPEALPELHGPDVSIPIDGSYIPWIYDPYEESSISRIPQSAFHVEPSHTVRTLGGFGHGLLGQLEMAYEGPVFPQSVHTLHLTTLYILSSCISISLCRACLSV